MRLTCKGLKIGNLRITTKQWLDNAELEYNLEDIEHILKTLRSKLELRRSPEEQLRDGLITHKDYIELKKKEKYKDGRRL